VHRSRPPTIDVVRVLRAARPKFQATDLRLAVVAPARPACIRVSHASIDSRAARCTRADPLRMKSRLARAGVPLELDGTVRAVDLDLRAVLAHQLAQALA